MGDESIQGAFRRLSHTLTLILAIDTDPIPVQFHPGHLAMYVEFIYGSWSCRVQWTWLWRSPVCKVIAARRLVTVFWCEEVKTLTFTDSLALYATATADGTLDVWYSPPYWGEEAFQVPISASHKWLPPQFAPSGETPQWWCVGCVSVIHPHLECSPKVEKHAPYTVCWDNWPLLGSVQFFWLYYFVHMSIHCCRLSLALLVVMN